MMKKNEIMNDPKKKNENALNIFQDNNKTKINENELNNAFKENKLNIENNLEEKFLEI